uniref:DUF3384 domain-containing protein n=1 Tax=Rhabditophanes sp. KR3021 TaxID=114890 RepID=A0AC35TU67_9BILA
MGDIDDHNQLMETPSRQKAVGSKRNLPYHFVISKMGEVNAVEKKHLVRRILDKALKSFESVDFRILERMAELPVEEDLEVRHAQIKSIWKLDEGANNEGNEGIKAQTLGLCIKLVRQLGLMTDQEIRCCDEALYKKFLGLPNEELLDLLVKIVHGLDTTGLSNFVDLLGKRAVLCQFVGKCLFTFSHKSDSPRRRELTAELTNEFIDLSGSGGIEMTLSEIGTVFECLSRRKVVGGYKGNSRIRNMAHVLLHLLDYTTPGADLLGEMKSLFASIRSMMAENIYAKFKELMQCCLPVLDQDFGLYFLKDLLRYASTDTSEAAVKQVYFRCLLLDILGKGSNLNAFRGDDCFNLIIKLVTNVGNEPMCEAGCLLLGQMIKFPTPNEYLEVIGDACQEVVFHGTLPSCKRAAKIIGVTKSNDWWKRDLCGKLIEGLNENTAQYGRSLVALSQLIHCLDADRVLSLADRVAESGTRIVEVSGEGNRQMTMQDIVCYLDNPSQSGGANNEGNEGIKAQTLGLCIKLVRQLGLMTDQEIRCCDEALYKKFLGLPNEELLDLLVKIVHGLDTTGLSNFVDLLGKRAVLCQFVGKCLFTFSHKSDSPRRRELTAELTNEFIDLSGSGGIEMTLSEIGTVFECLSRRKVVGGYKGNSRIRNMAHVLLHLLDYTTPGADLLGEMKSLFASIRSMMAENIYAKFKELMQCCLPVLDQGFGLYFLKDLLRYASTDTSEAAVKQVYFRCLLLDILGKGSNLNAFRGDDCFNLIIKLVTNVGNEPMCEAGCLLLGQMIKFPTPNEYLEVIGDACQEVVFHGTLPSCKRAAKIIGVTKSNDWWKRDLCGKLIEGLNENTAQYGRSLVALSQLIHCLDADRVLSLADRVAESGTRIVEVSGEGNRQMTMQDIVCYLDNPSQSGNDVDEETQLDGDEGGVKTSARKPLSGHGYAAYPMVTDPVTDNLIGKVKFLESVLKDGRFAGNERKKWEQALRSINLQRTNFEVYSKNLLIAVNYSSSKAIISLLHNGVMSSMREGNLLCYNTEIFTHLDLDAKNRLGDKISKYAEQTGLVSTLALLPMVFRDRGNGEMDVEETFRGIVVTKLKIAVNQFKGRISAEENSNLDSSNCLFDPVYILMYVIDSIARSAAYEAITDHLFLIECQYVLMVVLVILSESHGRDAIKDLLELMLKHSYNFGGKMSAEIRDIKLWTVCEFALLLLEKLGKLLNKEGTSKIDWELPRTLFKIRKGTEHVVLPAMAFLTTHVNEHVKQNMDLEWIVKKSILRDPKPSRRVKRIHSLSSMPIGVLMAKYSPKEDDIEIP